MRATLCLAATFALCTPLAWSDDKDAEQAALAKAFKDADLVFTAKVGKIDELGSTNSIPPSVFGKVTFKDVKALRGEAPESPTFNYSRREGSKQIVLESKDTVVVAIRQKGVTVVVPATEANLALAKGEK